MTEKIEEARELVMDAYVTYLARRRIDAEWHGAQQRYVGMMQMADTLLALPEGFERDIEREAAAVLERYESSGALAELARRMKG